MYIRGIYDGSLGSQRHDLPLHAAIHGHDLAAVIKDVKALRTEDCGKLTKKGLHEGWGWMVSSPIYLSFVTFPDIDRPTRVIFVSQRSCWGLNSHLWTKCQEIVIKPMMRVIT